ncbi:hypothetical protein [Desulfurobacterium sp.]
MIVTIRKDGEKLAFQGEVQSIEELKSLYYRIKQMDEKLGFSFTYDIPEAKDLVKQEISYFTDSYIKQKLKEIDEDLADLVSEKSWLEGVFASKGISPEQVRNETVLVILGEKTIDQAITDLSIPEDLKSDFERAVEIARIIAWKEAIWRAEEKLESQIDAMTLEQLLQLDVKALCENAYAEIPLEV